jgi:hypothetical protein
VAGTTTMEFISFAFGGRNENFAVKLNIPFKKSLEENHATKKSRNIIAEPESLL